MVAQVAKVIFHVPKVIARVFDPSRETICRQFGIETICPSTRSARSLVEALRNPPLEGPS